MIVLTPTTIQPGPAYALQRGTLRVEAAKIIGSFIASGTTTAGSRTSFTDASTRNGAAQSSIRAAQSWKGAYVLFTSGPEAGNWRRISDDQASTGVETVEQPFATGPTASGGDTYEIYAFLNPSQWSDCIDVGLTRCHYLSASPITLVTDGDMDALGTSSWFAVNANVTKNVSDSVIFGAQGLEVANTAAGGYAQSTNVPAIPNMGYRLWLDYRCKSGTAQLQVWDQTNNQAIQAWISPDQDSGVNAAGGGMSLGFTTPANCVSFCVQIGGVESTADIVFDDLIVLCNAQSRYPLPSWLTNKNQYNAVLQRWGVRPLDYKWTETGWPMNIEQYPTAVTAFRGDLPSPAAGRPYYLYGERPYGPMYSTDDAATTACPLEWAKYQVALAAIERYSFQLEQNSSARLRIDQADVAARLAEVDPLYKPEHSGRMGFSKPWLGARISQGRW